MRLAIACLLVACAPKPAPVRPVVAAPPPPPVTAPAAPIWPIAMRVMTWTPAGVVQVGMLPDAPPARPPTTPWYVEPTATLDDRTFAATVAAVRHEHVPGLSLRGQPIAAPWLAALADLPELSALVLDDTGVDTAALRSMRVTLRRLYLARTRIDDAALAWLAAAQALEVLDVEDCGVGDPGIAAIATIATLRAINASGTGISDAGAARLGDLESLEVVDLGHTRVGVKTVEALAQRPLHQLFLDHTHVGRAVAKLAPIAPRLERIDLSALVGYRPTDADVAWLANAPNLVEIGLANARITDALVLAIAQLPGLREVRLAGTPITARSIDALAARPDLEEIDLAETAVTDANAAALIALPHLRVLRLDRTAIGDAGLARPTPTLTELYLSRTKVSDAGLAILDDLPGLQALGLGEDAIGEATIGRVVKLAELRTLVLSKTRTDDDHLAGLGKLVHLERLYLDDTFAGDATVLALGAGPEPRPLRVLHLAASNVSDQALGALRKLALLEELTIGDARVHASIADLSAWPRLKTLSLVGIELGDPELPAIARARSLVRLDLSGTDVTDPTPLATLPELRELGLSQTRLSGPGKAAAAALARRGVLVVR